MQQEGNDQTKAVAVQQHRVQKKSTAAGGLCVCINDHVVLNCFLLLLDEMMMKYCLSIIYALFTGGLNEPYLP